MEYLKRPTRRRRRAGRGCGEADGRDEEAERRTGRETRRRRGGRGRGEGAQEPSIGQQPVTKAVLRGWAVRRAGQRAGRAVKSGQARPGRVREQR